MEGSGRPRGGSTLGEDEVSPAGGEDHRERYLKEKEKIMERLGAKRGRKEEGAER